MPGLYAHLKRRDDVVTLVKSGGIGVELGVAEGAFSERILNRNVLSYLYSIDMYAGDRKHDTEQYIRALKRLDPFRDRNSVLRMRFDEAVRMFDDEYFDFIYIDGYAHTGQEGGQTLRDWFPKLKKGGVFSGDDYSEKRWPLVVQVVDEFVSEHGLQLNVIDCSEDASYSAYPTWFAIK